MSPSSGLHSSLINARECRFVEITLLIIIIWLPLWIPSEILYDLFPYVMGTSILQLVFLFSRSSHRKLQKTFVGCDDDVLISIGNSARGCFRL
ncbi:hypothetical protein Y032_0112g335 [Ancylostoma ceylanicum]|uniref:Uncharacterized protein n=1 Tax=Ancylostoma ceylanicum TaxID=53326 RepID=A0A016TD53_9BILA|nr:hypothetical protein Y032_0112g335 [Ancylostoma ceylanicum]